MSLWVVVTIVAACMQVARTGLQKSLSADLDKISATWVRYLYALPLLPLLWLWLLLVEGGIPAIGWRFIGYCLAAGVAQIIATVILLALFDQRNFAVSTVLTKTEGVQVALLGVLVFAEPLSWIGFASVIVGGVGLLLLLPWRQSVRGSSVFYGLMAGFFFALTVWFIRCSYSEITTGTLAAVIMTLSVMIIMQTLLLWGYLIGRRGDFSAVWRVRRRAAGVGVLSLAGSFCWFWTFALTHPAYVKTLAQIELPLAFLLGRAAFAEKPTRLEIAGMVVVGCSSVIVAFA